jgi:hypothetical protein
VWSVSSLKRSFRNYSCTHIRAVPILHNRLQPTVRSREIRSTCDFTTCSQSEEKNHVRPTNNGTLLPLRHSRYRLSNRHRRRNRRPTNLHCQTTQQLQLQNHHIPPRRYSHTPILYPFQSPKLTPKSLRLHPSQHPPPRRLLRNRRLHSLHPRRPPLRQPPMGRRWSPNLHRTHPSSAREHVFPD